MRRSGLADLRDEDGRVASYMHRRGLAHRDLKRPTFSSAKRLEMGPAAFAS